MKKNYFILTFLLTGLLVNAQVDLSNLSFGVKAGANMSSILADFESSPVYSFHAGGYFEAEITEGVIIRPELLYSSEGFNAETYDYELDSKIESEVKLNYLSLVMVFKYEISEGFGFEGGGTFSYLLSGKQTDKSNTTTYSVDIEDEIRKIDVALTGGLYYEFETGLNFSLRYSYGILSVYKSTDDYTTDFDTKRGLLQFSVGYTL
ncbi:porin family protein [Lacinutrix algicola]|uniref:porin family protein n=1 Tax=Lacinutrix algicola TaxID=342954 RepID=UPI0006E259B1|nr:porin family protein [Lacinutrix algicola]